MAESSTMLATLQNFAEVEKSSLRLGALSNTPNGFCDIQTLNFSTSPAHLSTKLGHSLLHIKIVIFIKFKDLSFNKAKAVFQRYR